MNFLKLFRYFLKSFVDKIIFQLDLLRYRSNSYPKKIDFDWESKHYNRIALVNLLCNKNKAQSYLEIGCASNSLFNSVPVVNKIGVDPSSGGTHRMTSDEFFSTNKRKFDLIFIDGLHTYAQVRRDIENSINFLNKNGYIAIHDMLPRNWIEGHIPVITSGDWTGDVWKSAFEISQTNGLDFKIINIDHGVGVIRVRNKNIKLKNLTAFIQNKKFDYFFENYKKLPIIDWLDCQKWI